VFLKMQDPLQGPTRNIFPGFPFSGFPGVPGFGAQPAGDSKTPGDKKTPGDTPDDDKKS
jgi:hypothetical protein